MKQKSAVFCTSGIGQYGHTTPLSLGAFVPILWLQTKSNAMFLGMLWICQLLRMWFQAVGRNLQPKCVFLFAKISVWSAQLNLPFVANCYLQRYLSFSTKHEFATENPSIHVRFLSCCLPSRQGISIRSFLETFRSFLCFDSRYRLEIFTWLQVGCSWSYLLHLGKNQHLIEATSRKINSACRAGLSETRFWHSSSLMCFIPA